MSKKVGAALVMFVCLVVTSLFLVWGGVVAYKAIKFNIDCGGHVKRAADSNTIELATQELKTVLDYLEEHKLTEGYTSILYRTPDEDVGFWYQNLKASLGELEQVSSTATQLEKSNLLIKLRETLLDQGKEGISITKPDGISRFPLNTAYAIMGIVFFVLFIVGGIGTIISFNILTD
jgi:hypothetical protein